MTTIERIISYLTKYGPANSGDIGKAVNVPASTAFSILFRNEELFHSRPGRNQRGNACLVWDVFRVVPTAAPAPGTTVEWRHTAPSGPPVTLRGQVLGADWDGVHVLAHGCTFAVPLREVHI